MARDSGVKVSGLRELVKDLQSVGVEVADLKAAFKVLSDRAQQVAQRYAPRLTGRLAQSIKPVQSKNKAAIRAGGGRVPYAGAIEYGWPARNIRPANFMGKADTELRQDTQPTIEREIEKIIKEKGLT